MRVVVDFDLCESNAVCVAEAPEVFELGSDDYLTVLLDEPPERMWAAVGKAALLCPKQAIRIERDRRSASQA